MRTVALVAVNVFKESVRDKVLYNLVVFAILLIATSFLLGQLTAGQDVKIIKDLGLAAISVFGLLIAVFIGIGLVWKEVEKKSIYSLLSKPIARHEFILGKSFGLLLTLFVNIGMMTIAFYAVLAYLGWVEHPDVRAGWSAPAADPRMLQSILLIAVELMLVTALALFFSTFSSPFLSALLTFGLWVIGHFNADLRGLEVLIESPGARWLGQALYYVLPNFSAFDIKAQAVWGQPVDGVYVAVTVAYGMLYVTLVLISALIVFSRRDFK